MHIVKGIIHNIIIYYTLYDVYHQTFRTIQIQVNKIVYILTKKNIIYF